MADSPSKVDGGAERRTAGYKSWKKKYRKMRITFDNKMHECEELHKQEAKAAATVKRLAIENDRLLDLLLDVNNSPQIPPERRIDLSLKPSSDKKALSLPMDLERAMRKDIAFKRLEEMLHTVPHSTYNSAKESNSSLLSDLVIPEGESHPANFLTADDIDDYLYIIDTRVDPDSRPPTLAPLAHPTNNPAPNPQLKNPTSVTNWLRKHAPKIFLQDGETHDADEIEGTGGTAGASGGHASARKSRGGVRGDRGGSKASAKSKRTSTAGRASLAAAERGDWDASQDDDPDFGATPVARGKRKRDEDPGYRPRGSSSRPTKKKRKSDVEATPTVRKSKKEIAIARKDD